MKGIRLATTLILWPLLELPFVIVQRGVNKTGLHSIGIIMTTLSWKLYCTFVFFSSLCFAGDKSADKILPNPFESAKKGQRVVYRIAGSTLQRSTITDIDEQGKISIQIDAIVNDEPMFVGESIVTAEMIKEARIMLLETADSYYIEHGIHCLLDKEISVIIVSYVKDNRQKKITLSEEISLYGEILIEESDLPFPVSELVDYKN